MAEILADEPGIMIIFLDQVSDLDAVNVDSLVLLLNTDNNLFIEFENGRTNPVEDDFGKILLIEL